MDNRIYRSRETKMLGGVCGGIADMFNMDPTLVRLVAVALTFLSGFTFLLVYVLCAIIIPLEPEPGYILRRHQQPADSGFPQPTEPTPAAPPSQVREDKPMQTPETEKEQAPGVTEKDDGHTTQKTADEKNQADEIHKEFVQSEAVDAPQADNDETVINTEADRY